MTANFYVGQPVKHITLGKYGRERDARVVRVGRKFAYIALDEWPDREHSERFRLSDGYEQSDFSASSRIATDELLAAEHRRRAAMERVKPLRQTYGLVWEGLPVEQVEAIADVFDGGAK